MALSFLAAYTGPITIYYGDEYGAEFDGLSINKDELYVLMYIAPDNVARDPGRIDGFTSDEQDLIEYLRYLMDLRDTYSSLWNGDRENLYVSDTVYIDIKTDDSSSVLYGLNIDDSESTLVFTTLEIGGTKLTNLLTGQETFAVDGTITITLTELTGSFYLIE